MKRIIGILSLALLLFLFVGWIVSGGNERGSCGNLAAVECLEGDLDRQSGESLRLQENLAMWYNLSLRGQGSTQETAGAYADILRFEGGAMGSIEFPEAEVILPVYHGTQDPGSVNGLTHAAQSAFPIGGEGNHSVLVGKNGDSDGELRLDLGELETGDIFVVNMLRNQRTYRVERKWECVAKPEYPAAESGRDLCTLIVQDGGRWIVVRAEAEEAG